MAVYNLSRLKKGASLGKPTNPGQWADIKGTLSDLADSLDINEDIRVDAVRAIPDPWAQLRVFSEALLYKKLGTVVGEWRGLLALIALAERYANDYRLEFDVVDLTVSKSSFSKVMTELAPRRGLLLNAGNTDANWLKPVIVQFSPTAGPRQPLAVLNPLCLIALGRDCEKIASQSVPWMKNGLCDPTGLKGDAALPLEEIRALHHYIVQLRDDLTRQCLDVNDEHKRINELLEDYARDCLDPALQPGVSGCKSIMTSGEPIGDLPPLYRCLRRAVEIEDPPPGSSDCCVPLRDDIGVVPYKGLILFDLSISNLYERPASRISLWRSVTLSRAAHSPAVLAQVKNEAASEGYLLVEINDFFTEVLVRLNIKGRDGHIPAHPSKFADRLLPLSPLVLLTLKTEDLKAAIEIDADGYVTLALPIANSDRKHRIRRRFGSEPKAGDGRSLEEIAWGYGDVAFWPDFQSDKWGHYFARLTFQTKTDRRLRGRLATSGRALSGILRDEASQDGLTTRAGTITSVQRAALVDAWKDSRPFGDRDRLPPLTSRLFLDPLLERLKGREHEGVAVEVQASQAPFECIFFTVVPKDGQPTPAGLALIDFKSAPLAEREGVVAVDFGTTNTVACIASEQPAAFKSRIVHPIGSRTREFLARAETDMAKNFQDFLPPDEQFLPTPSVVIRRELDQPAQAALDAQFGSENQLLFKHLVYFQPSGGGRSAVGNLNLEDWRSLLDLTVFNLKWTTDERDMIAAKRYLRQIIMMLAAEALDMGFDPTKLRWRFSRPESMADDDDFRTTILDQIKDVVPAATNESLDALQSEGLSAAKYILTVVPNREFHRRAVNVIFDIGGATTDVAIWGLTPLLTPVLCWSGSFRLAGGDFFTNHIITNPDVLKDFGLPQWAKVLQPTSTDGKPLKAVDLKHVGELLFSGAALDEAMTKRWIEVRSSTEVSRLLQTSYVYLGGVAWRVGKVLRDLIDTGKIDESARDKIAVALCGRGAGLFARVQGLSDRSITPVSRLLAMIGQAAGAADPEAPSVFLSPQRKTEVAAGMIISGVDVESGATPIRRGVAHDVKTPTEADRPMSIDTPALLAELDEFLMQLPRFADFSLTLSTSQRDRLPVAAADFQNRDLKAGLPLQHPFIGALKELVSMVAQPPSGNLRPTIKSRSR